MKKKHLLKSAFAALMVLCLCTADLTPAAALVTQAQIDALKSHLASQLEAYCVPDEIIMIDTIPRTFSGKLMRKSLGILYNK